MRPSRSSSESAGGMNRVLAVLQKDCGIDFKLYKLNTIQRRTARRMLLHKMESIGEYADYLHDHPGESEELYNDILIPVTRFFRDADAFDWLKSVVFPAILKDRSNQGHIRVWVPGCSTGEETYSLAMALLEFLGDRAASYQVQLFGTDISDKGISKARSGVYPEKIAQDVSTERLQRFFRKIETGYRVSKGVRDMCVFVRQNLAGDPPFSEMNLISCRNTLIYLGTDLQRKILPTLHNALKPSGFLFLGNSESAAAFPGLFAPVNKQHRIFVRKATDTGADYDFRMTRPKKHSDS